MRSSRKSSRKSARRRNSRKSIRRGNSRNSKKVRGRVSKRRVSQRSVKRSVKRRVQRRVRRRVKRRTSRRNLRGGAPFSFPTHNPLKGRNPANQVLTERLLVGDSPVLETGPDARVRTRMPYAFQEELDQIAAAEQAEQERVAAEQAEQERVAAEQERVAAEQERVAAGQAEQERVAAEQAEQGLRAEGLSHSRTPGLGRIYTVNQETDIKEVESDRSQTVDTLSEGSRITCEFIGQERFIAIKDEHTENKGYVKYYNLDTEKALITDTGEFATFNDEGLDAALKQLSISDFHSELVRGATDNLRLACNVLKSYMEDKESVTNPPFVNRYINDNFQFAQTQLKSYCDKHKENMERLQPLITRVGEMKADFLKSATAEVVLKIGDRVTVQGTYYSGRKTHEIHRTKKKYVDKEGVVIKIEDFGPRTKVSVEMDDDDRPVESFSTKYLHKMKSATAEVVLKIGDRVKVSIDKKDKKYNALSQFNDRTGGVIGINHTGRKITVCLDGKSLLEKASLLEKEAYKQVGTSVFALSNTENQIIPSKFLVKI